MTQGIYPFPQEQLSFEPNINQLPPFEIEAEEEIIGGILYDPNAINRVKDRLRPEHFYIRAHKDIYQACLKLSKKGEGTDLLSVTSWLTKHDILTRVGGRAKLASLVTVSALNIDHMAKLVIDAAIRRDVIKVSEDIRKLGHSTDIDISEMMYLLSNKVKSIIDTPLYETKEESQRSFHDRLLNELSEIYTTCEQPTLRLLKLRDLAEESQISMKLLELLYLKSLTEQCSKLLTYEELKELAGSTVREWLMNGLVPKNTTILLAADGGIGKTKFAYGIGKVLIQGSEFGQFNTTGQKRKILYYQGDESPGDMFEALEILGYSEEDISKYVRVRFGWSGENIPTLLHDLKEFQPELVFIDSLSTANRYSVYKESEMEYARPILELTGLASQYKTTFVIIHHTNKEGGVRGTTAIRNAVSEVWQLTKDTSQTATPNDRILEINKSRSRSSGKKYRLMFNPEDLGFTFLGEEVEQPNGAGQSAKESTLQLLADNRNIGFTSEEIANRLGASKAYARRYLAELASDGLVSVNRQPGKPNTYYLVYEDHLRITPGSPPGSPKDHPQDHPLNLDIVSNVAKGDPRSASENFQKIPTSEILKTSISEDQDHLCSNTLPGKNPGGDPGGDPSLIVCESIHFDKNAIKALSDKDSGSFSPGDPGGDPLPLLQAKASYWSLSQRREVEAFNINDELLEVSCKVPGLGIRSLPFDDLRCCEQSPRQTFRVGDKVVILEGKYKETFATVTTIRTDGIWLKSDDRKKSLAKAFFPHQLVKV